LYGEPIVNTAIVNEGTPTPEIAEAFVSSWVEDEIDSTDLTNQADLL